MITPGEWVRAVCARCFDAATMSHVIDPIVADMQAEYDDARKQNRLGRRLAVLLGGYGALLKALLLLEGMQTVEFIVDWNADDHRTLRRMFGWILGATVLTVLLIVVRPFLHVIDVSDGLADRSRLFLFLTPQALSVAIPFGATVGIAVGLSRRRVSNRLAHFVVAVGLVWSCLTFVNVAWVTPAAKRTYRAQAGQSVGTMFMEQSIWQMSQKVIDLRRRDPSDRTARMLAIEYSTRLALCGASLSLTLFVLAVVTRRGAGRIVGILTGLGAPFGYYMALAAIVFAARAGVMPEFFVAWFPGVAVTLLALLIVRLLPSGARTVEVV